jgi:carbon storage regulator
MLVLSRKLGERQVIPQCGLVVTVVSVRGNRVRLGITAPADVAVYREEVWPGPATAAEAARPARQEQASEPSTSAFLV